MGYIELNNRERELDDLRWEILNKRLILNNLSIKIAVLLLVGFMVFMIGVLGMHNNPIGSLLVLIFGIFIIFRLPNKLIQENEKVKEKIKRLEIEYKIKKKMMDYE